MMTQSFTHPKERIVCVHNLGCGSKTPMTCARYLCAAELLNRLVVVVRFRWPIPRLQPSHPGKAAYATCLEVVWCQDGQDDVGIGHLQSDGEFVKGDSPASY